MKLRVSKAQGLAIGHATFVPWLSKDGWEYSSERWLDLDDLSTKEITKLAAVLTAKKAVRGVPVLLRDIETWQRALTDASTLRPRTVRQAATLIRQYVSKVPSHILFERVSEEVWLPYYVGSVQYARAVNHGHSTTPEHVKIELFFETLGGQQNTSLILFENECEGTVVEILAREEYYAETTKLRVAHEAEMVKYHAWFSQVGMQMLAIGTGTDNLDGTGNHERSGSTYQLLREGQPTRVVVDVVYEEDSTRRDHESRVYFDRSYWWPRTVGEDKDEDEKDSDDREGYDINAPRAPVVLPTHTFVPVFDMSKHIRLRVHVGYLTPYVYDKSLAEKLVLPEDIRALVRMLIEHKGGVFQDIIKNKSGGAVVLLAGRPGVGKTLTAEVYAESEARALYSVQCSQLGIDTKSLEEQLLLVFLRARRWNAVLLLDEADVYVHERGSDLQQNAIVGVFLRVLEYQDSLLFLTTNRPEDVDDAIASRCVARITYPLPTAEEQAKIWRILATASSATLDEAELRAIVKQSPDLSGRDVKNLLKLVLLMKGAAKKGTPVTAAEVAFVKRFHPTGRLTAPEVPDPEAWDAL